MSNDIDSLRSAAELIVNTSRTVAFRNMAGVPMSNSFDINRPHSINLITEEFLGGYMQDGRMSVVRRFFCLFVTFDLFFVALMWLICIMINGDNIFQAFQKQILHYSIYTSLFDIVFAAICRFLVLIIFYAFVYINHWFIIALSTSGSCFFLISKVFVYDWVDSKQQVFEVILIMASFVLSWGEAWFLDCRVLPQERHARRYFSNLPSTELSPNVAPFLASPRDRRPPESVADFYSPLDSDHNSDEEEEQDEEYHQMGLNCIRNAYELLQESDWKVEKVTAKGDTIYSRQHSIGKIYRLTARIKYPAKALLDEIFYKVEHVPKWNPTLLESKIVRKINSYTDITYQASVGAGGGIIKSRDFVNLRCWRLFRNGNMCQSDSDNEPSTSSSDDALNNSCEGSVSTLSDVDGAVTPQARSVELSSGAINPQMFGAASAEQHVTNNPFCTLSKSLGAKDFGDMNPFASEEPPPLTDEFQDASDTVDKDVGTGPFVQFPLPSAAGGNGFPAASLMKNTKDKVWVSAAISIDYPQVPPTSKYVRGQNLVAGFAMREIAGKSDACIFEWILCLDLKGYVPRKILDSAYTSFMSDYMTYLRKYVNELRQRRKRNPKH